MRSLCVMQVWPATVVELYERLLSHTDAMRCPRMITGLQAVSADRETVVFAREPVKRKGRG
jgi:hypothetical protein